jgi:dCMP deaminase
MGTVVVRDQQILMCTTNAELYGHSARRELHAEARAISQCGRYGISTTGATIYITMPPCVDCFLVIAASGITRCVYRGRQREECVTQLAEHNMIEMVDGFDLPNSATWQTEATLVWDRYFAKYPEKMPARVVERRRKAAELQQAVSDVDAHQSS